MSIRTIHNELILLNLTEIREFYKMLVPRFNVNALNLTKGHFFKDLEYALNDDTLVLNDDVDELVSSIATTIPTSNKIDRYNIEIIRTNLLDDLLNIVLITFDRPIHDLNDSNVDLEDIKTMGLNPYYIFTGGEAEDLVIAIDLAYVEITPFLSLFYVIRGLIEFIISLPETDVHIDKTENKLEVEMMKSLMACDVLYEDAALYILENTILNFPDLTDDEKDDCIEVLEEMWEYFETDYKGKYYTPDIIQED